MCALADSDNRNIKIFLFVWIIGYHAPMDVFLELNRLSWESEGDSMQYNICMGKEWYRYPSSFFLPNKYI